MYILLLTSGSVFFVILLAPEKISTTYTIAYTILIFLLIILEQYRKRKNRASK